nr:polyprotein 1ab [Lactate dehydrogenase-elevating virus]
MQSGFDRCLCTPNARVFWERGQVYCTRCLAARPLLPLSQQHPRLGALGLFYRPASPLSWEAPVTYPTKECRPGGMCWLSSIYPIARMTSGNHNFQARLNFIASVVYRDGKLTSKHLEEDFEVYSRGCRWYPITGPVPGIALYANAVHVSDESFPGATHVLSNLPLPQQPLRKGLCPFADARANVWRYKGNTVFVSPQGYLWTTGSNDSVPEPWGEDRRLCEKIISSLPADHLVKINFSNYPFDYSFTGGDGAGFVVFPCKERDTKFSKCWEKIFEDHSGWMAACEEADLADRMGYRTPAGVAGPYLARRLQARGLRAVVKPENNDYIVWALGVPESYIRHVSRAGEPVEEFFVKVGEFSIVSNCVVTPHPKFRFQTRKYYGYSPPGDGACGLHCISAMLNDIFGDSFTTRLGKCSRDSSEWLSDQDLYQLVMTANLPATIGHCPSAIYKLDCVNQHWTVTKRKGDRALGGLAPDCVRGVCGGECKFVPTFPRDIDLSPIVELPTSTMMFGLGLEPYCDSWNFTNSVLVDDDFAHAIARAGEEYRRAMGIPRDDWVILAELMTENCRTRHQVLEKLQRGLQLQASSRPSSPASVSPASSVDLSAAGLLLSGTESDKEAVVAVNDGCYTVLGFDKNEATKSEQDLATDLFCDLVKPMETSTTKLESRKILEAAAKALESCKPKRKRSRKKKTRTPSPTCSVDAAVAEPTSVNSLGNQDTSETCASEKKAEKCPTPTPPPRPKRAALKNSNSGCVLKDIIWNQTEPGVKCLTIVEDVRAFLKGITPPGGVLSTRSRITKHIVDHFHSICEQTPELVLAHAEHQAKNLHELLLAEPALLILGVGEDTLKKLVRSQPSVPRSVGFGAWLSDPGPKSSSSGEGKFVDVELDPTPVQQESDVGKSSDTSLPAETTGPESQLKVDPTPQASDPGGGYAHRFFSWLNHQVFVLSSHLLAVWSVIFGSRQVLGVFDYVYTLFCLCCVLLCFYLPAIGFVPLVGCVFGSPWRVRLSVFSVWLCVAVVVFQEVLPEPGAVCTSASAECAAALERYTSNGVHRPVNHLSVGLVGTVAGFVARLVGGPRRYWFYFLRLMVVLDLGLVFLAVALRGRCKKCFCKCVRTASHEVQLRVFPSTKVARTTLEAICDMYSAPRVDPIFIATGVRGCWTGSVSPHQVTEKPVSYSNLDDKKISNKTVVPPPTDPQQAVRCLKVLQCGGSIQDVSVPEVKKVTKVPFKAPFFPNVTIDPECYIVVDPVTYSAAMRGGYGVSHLIVGLGDFAEVNGLRFVSGGQIADFVCLGLYVLLNFLLSAWLSSPVSCGRGTNDPWCRNPFSYPVVGQGVMCNSHLCVAEDGLTSPMTLSYSLIDWALMVAIMATVAIFFAKISLLVDVVCVFCCLLMYAFPSLSIAAFGFPFVLCKVSLHPITLVWVQFFLLAVNVWAGVASVVVLISSWFLARATSSLGLITPYDVHMITATPRGASSLASAPEGTYLAAVRRSALTGRCCMFVPTNFGSVLEGSLRTRGCAKNVVSVFGSASGSGGVFTINGNPVVVTASHLLSDGKARVSCVGFSQCLDFKCAGDYAFARVANWKGDAPKAELSHRRGRAYWLTASGVEPGFVGENSAFCFTKCGDSGSPVVDEDGNLLGIHTGSNKRGSGMVTTHGGKTLGMANVKLSEMCPHYSGPGVPVSTVKLPKHLVVDVETVPSDLVAVVESLPALEGALSSMQLLCVFFFLWRLIHVPFVPVIAIAFFFLNEILPVMLARLMFSFALSLFFCVHWLFCSSVAVAFGDCCSKSVTGYSVQVLLLRLVIAALNRSLWSFWFFFVGAIVSMLSDAVSLGDTRSCTWLFVPRAATDVAPKEIFFILLAIHVFALFLSLFKRNALADMLVGNGCFDAAFFLKYFAEGNLRDGVSDSCNMTPEGLTAALAITLSDDDLEFLQRHSDFKCFVSASNMRNGAKEFIESAYARALRAQLAATDKIKASKSILAKLESFAGGVVTQVEPGDVVVVLGKKVIGDLVEVVINDAKHVIRVIETRTMAGTQFSVGTICGDLENACEDPSGLVKTSKKQARRQKRTGLGTEVVGTVVIDGVSYNKVWHKATGDVTYEGCLVTENPKLRPLGMTTIGRFQEFIRKHGEKVKTSVEKYPVGKKKSVEFNITTYLLDGEEYDVPDHEPLEWTITIGESDLEAERLTVDQALRHMGHDSLLTAKEKEKLARIIESLNGLQQASALNLLATSGLDRCTRGGLTVSGDAVKLVRYHSRTFSIGDVNLKVMGREEYGRTVGKQGHCLVANLVDGVVVMRKHEPSLVDVLLTGEDADLISPTHGPGNTGVHGFTWDFEAPPTDLELELSEQIITACSIRRGDAPSLDLPYKLHPVRGNPYRDRGVLYNTRFGDIKYLTPQKTKEPLHAAACFNPKGVPVSDSETLVATTLPHGFELYVPTIPQSVLEYLDSRPDTPKMLTKHGCARAAECDLQKFDLSRQGFVLPGVLYMVRRYLCRLVGIRRRLFLPSTYPAKNSMAGINGNRFPTHVVQSHPDIDALCERACKEHWQTVTPCTLKKQYCSKAKTRTILGTNNFVALGLRSALSGVTQGFMRKGIGSPICLGKNKFTPLPTKVSGRCLEADLASCDRSTPAIIRWFTTNLLFELAGAEEWIPSYVLNCCHDVVSTMSGCFDKRGGLSSGDPVTSVSNTVYSLVIYAQHMVLSAFRCGHKVGGLFLRDSLEMEQLFELQPLLVYSDDVVLYNESSELPNYHFFVDHLDLMLGFKTDRSKTVITSDPNFLGCRIAAGRVLVPQRDRILAALAYHMKASCVSDYFASAAAILMDACACCDYDEDWYFDLVCGIADCARKEGFRFPGPSFYVDMWKRLSVEEKKKCRTCAHCGAPSTLVSSCGLNLCDYHGHGHPHCPVVLPCGHAVGSGVCDGCSSPVMSLNTELDKLLACVPYHPPKVELLSVNDGVSSLPPGRYQARGGVVSVRRDILGNVVDLPDGDYQVMKVAQTCADICMVSINSHILRSQFITGAPGTGKTTYLLSVVRDDDVIYTPTHRTMLDVVKALGTCRFDPPKDTPLEFPVPSRTGPCVRLIGAGFIPGRVSYLDEAAYCNPLDVLKILSKTPLVCVGDLNQLPPVGFNGPCFAFSLMPGRQLIEVFRFGPSIVNPIKKFYREELVSRGPDTGVKFLKSYQPYGQVLTPYHRDRVDGAITIDSSQGCTYDVITVYLPTPKSLNSARALVAITRARFYVFVYDPHNQLEQYLNMSEHEPAGAVAFWCGEQPMMISEGRVQRLSGPAQTTDPKLQQLMGLEGTASPLPQVAHNLGFYYSPDLVQFARIPSELCKHWPVVTAQNRTDWPDRLVCSMSKIDKCSRAIFCAGYHVGPSVFLGVPGVVSYYLTKFLKGKPVPLPDSLMSTGRIALNVREYLDEKEMEFSSRCPHAFIGEVKGSNVGGCHHVTSRYLPPVLVPGSVVKIGVSCPGKAAKELCTVTDVYLPELDPYLNPPTKSMDYKLLVDFQPVKLMVWKDATAYFHEGIRPMESMSRFLKVPQEEGVFFDLDEFVTNAKVSKLPCKYSVSANQFLTDVVLSMTHPSLAPPDYELLFARAYCVPGLDVGTLNAYIYRRGPSTYTTSNIARLVKDTAVPVGCKGSGYMFPK